MACLTVVAIGGGLVGMELLGELTAFAEDVLRFYPHGLFCVHNGVGSEEWSHDGFTKL